ncbi:MAG: adenylate/guanylate cyclase domain-containing protein [Pontiellaceae bacterium]|nr:adenylate/guanylate cyclase domain-containing protein [Pontiellaceae bacterium]MBN2784619.1 adenylate/guanylate cyclase domain-containing protein [Pontiellaceae bacterium]
MKKRLPLIVGILLLLAGAFCYIYEPAILSDLSRRAFDIYLKKQAKPVQSDAVAIVDIDDASMEAYGQWPWPRYRLAELMEQLWARGAAVVVFDVIFVEPDRTSPEELKKEWQSIWGDGVSIRGIEPEWSDYDLLFAETLSVSNSVLGCFLHGSDEPVAQLAEGDESYFRGVFFEKGMPDRNWLPQADNVQAPITALAKRATGQAFINTIPDPDNIIRSTPLVLAYGPNRIYPSLSMEAIRLYAQAKKVGIIYDDEGADGVQYIQVFDGKIPTDGHGRLSLNYRSTRFPSFSVRDILEGHIPDDAFYDRIVFVGTSAAGLQDVVPTLLDPEFPGVEVHATAVDNMLAGDILREPVGMILWNLLGMVIGGIVLTLLVVYAPSLVSFLILMIAETGAAGLSYWLLKHKSLIANPVETMVVWSLVFLGVIAVKYWQEERGRQRMRGMFGTMVSKDVLKYLEDNPGSFSLKGERAEATMFFSDVAGFTTISESLPPEKLADLLNRYLSPMTQIIMDRGGYVDKYEGDAIMAEWGVPFPMENHAVEACLAALEQQEKLAELRDELKVEYGHELYVRMGINSGTVTAGNMGSENRFSYTVMGDAVNQAARFESGNKPYGTAIMIGETTREAIGDAFEVRLLDLLVVKGKTKPIRVYELLARKGELREDKTFAIECYGEALSLHWKRQFEEALDILAKGLERIDDPPSIMLKRRIEGYIEQPPDEHWQGEFVNTSK